MPTYDYRCKACGYTFELYQTMSEGEKRKCPECAKNSLERLIGAGAGLIFKGSGYYLTDYRSKSYEEGAKAERDAAKPVEAKASTSDTKDAAGKEPATQGSGAKDGAKAKEPSDSKSARPSDAKAPKSDSSSASKGAPSAKKSSPKRKR